VRFLGSRRQLILALASLLALSGATAADHAEPALALASTVTERSGADQ